MNLNPLHYTHLPAAVFGSAILGGCVFYLNSEYASGPAMIAASKQAVYTFFFGGMWARWCEVLSLKYDKAIKARFISMIYCTSGATSATLLVHLLRGTPEPLISVLPTFLTSPPAFFAVAWWTQYQEQKEIQT